MRSHDIGIERIQRSMATACLFLAVLVFSPPRPAASAPSLPDGYQRNVSPDGREIATAWCRPATASERGDPSIAPDGWVQEGPRESFTNGEVPLPTAPDWVGTRTRAVGALVWFDADADGDQDLFVGTYWANQYPPLVDYYNFLYLNAGGMLEANPSWISADEKHTGDASWGYINNDAYPDLFVANGGSSLQPSQVFYGRNGLLPTTAGWQNNGGTWTTGCDLADFDLDGDTDVATSNQGTTSNPYRPTYVYRNTGNGLETSPFWQSSQVGITSECDWGDMDGDGYPDLAVSGWVNWQTGVFHNLGTTLDPGFVWTTGHPERTDKGVGWADVDGDGDLDLAVGGSGDPDWLFLNSGNMLGDTAVWASGEAYTGCQDLAWVDIDRDGDPDLASIHFSTGHVRIYLNNGGTLSPLADWQYDATSSGSAIAFGDVNGDGWPDLAIGVANGPVELFINRGLPTGVAEGPARRDGRISLGVGRNPFEGSLPLTVESAEPVTVMNVELIGVNGRRAAQWSHLDAGARRTHTLPCDLSPLRPGAVGAGVYLVRVSGRDLSGRTWSLSRRVVRLGN